MSFGAMTSSQRSGNSFEAKKTVSRISKDDFDTPGPGSFTNDPRTIGARSQKLRRSSSGFNSSSRSKLPWEIASQNTTKDIDFYDSKHPRDLQNNKGGSAAFTQTSQRFKDGRTPMTGDLGPGSYDVSGPPRRAASPGGANFGKTSSQRFRTPKAQNEAHVGPGSYNSSVDKTGSDMLGTQTRRGSSAAFKSTSQRAGLDVQVGKVATADVGYYDVTDPHKPAFGSTKGKGDSHFGNIVGHR